MQSLNTLTQEEYDFFHINGFLVKRKFIETDYIQQLQNKVINHLNNRVKPYELEQEVHYPGSPKTVEEKGGDTIRRLLLAYTRDPVFTKWAENSEALQILKKLFSSNELYLVQSHHNCIMTKQPKYSSETHWHKDIRYWNFENQNLINTWLPLGEETKDNGCLLVIPGSHEWDAPRENLDERLFLRQDLEINQAWLETAIEVELKKGDLLFFHASLFHAAGRNRTTTSKNAIVTTYHSESNHPLKNTKSVKFDEVLLS